MDFVSTVIDIVKVSRIFVAEAFRTLPILLASTIFLLGFAQGNANYLLFATGFAIVTPFFAWLTNIVTEFVLSKTGLDTGIWNGFSSTLTTSASSACLFTARPTGPYSGHVNLTPTYWYTMMIFFLTYLFLNAYDLYNREQSDSAPKVSVDARKGQAIAAMTIVCILGIALSILRWGTACETVLGMLVGFGIGIGIAQAWFTLVRNCGMGRLDDLFGISNRILPLQSLENEPPVVCVPNPDP
jgi:hypothetical protein